MTSLISTAKSLLPRTFTSKMSTPSTVDAIDSSSRTISSAAKSLVPWAGQSVNRLTDPKMDKGSSATPRNSANLPYSGNQMSYGLGSGLGKVSMNQPPGTIVLSFHTTPSTVRGPFRQTAPQPTNLFAVSNTTPLSTGYRWGVPSQPSMNSGTGSVFSTASPTNSYASRFQPPVQPMGHSAMTGSFRGASNFPSRPPPQTQLPPTPKGPRFRMFVGSDGLRVYDDGRVAQVSVTSIICGDGRVGTTTNFKHGSHVESMVDLEITPGGHRLVTVYHDSVPQSEVVVPPRMMNAYSSMSNAFPSDTRSQDGYHRGRGDGTSYSPLRPEVVVEEDDDLVTYY